MGVPDGVGTTIDGVLIGTVLRSGKKERKNMLIEKVIVYYF